MAKFPDWIYRQSAALAYRLRDGSPEVLLITSRKGTRWVLPKGIVEPGLTPRESAAKEAWEEAGIEGQVSAECLGSYDYEKWGGTCNVEVFPMKVTAELDTWPEAAARRRKWFPLARAAKRIDERDLRKLVRRLPKTIEAHAKPARRPLAAAGRARRVIYLFRHAKSSWDDPTLEDFDRPLAPRGRRATEVMRNYMRLADVRPDLVLCSSSVRTRQTLENVHPAIGASAKVRYDRKLYHGGVLALSNRLRRLPDEVASVMLVGHNPVLQDLAVSLTGCGDRDAIARVKAKFPTAGLVTLVLQRDHWRDLESGACELHSFVVPRSLV
jgi:phosphohistidine phosphatase